MSRKLNILIVEDEVIFAQLLTLNLEEAGYNVYDYLTTGEEATLFVQEKQPDLILMDVHLVGEIDGIEAAEKISEKYKIPIIFMSGYEETSILERINKIHSVAYLTKPVEIWDLEPVIESFFAKEI